jgi:hypothetical protein
VTEEDKKSLAFTDAEMGGISDGTLMDRIASEVIAREDLKNVVPIAVRHRTATPTSKDGGGIGMGQADIDIEEEDGVSEMERRRFSRDDVEAAIRAEIEDWYKCPWNKFRGEKPSDYDVDGLARGIVNRLFGSVSREKPTPG